MSNKRIRILTAAAAFLALAAVVNFVPGQSSDPLLPARRAAVLDGIGPGLAVLPSQITSPRGPQPVKDFLYLTGLEEPEAVLVLDGGSDNRCVLFNRSGRWTGAGEPGALEVRPVTELRAFLSRAARDRKVHVPFTGLESALTAMGGTAAVSGASALVPLEPLIAPLRMIKSPDEIAILKRAIDITTEAYIEALKAVRPGMRESDVDAVIQFTNLRRGAVSSFTQIASGPNSVNIHFGSTPRVMEAGDVIVFDLGAWYEKNTSDISRTIPVSGRFTKEQAEIYELVLRAQKEAIRLMTPGTTAIVPQEAAEKVLMEGLQTLGLVTDPASPWQRRFHIQHGFGHGIGLDVHDVWSWWSPRMRTETLKPGMVLTMEPGLYFPPGRLEKITEMFRSQASAAELEAFVAAVAPAYAKYQGLGCRIEDDVLITETGHVVLSAAAPKEIPDIERMMKLAGPFEAVFK